MLDGLSGLVHKSLVLQEEHGGEARYRLRETVPQYALEGLAASGEAEVLRRRHALSYLALAEAAEPQLWGPEQVGWLERLERGEIAEDTVQGRSASNLIAQAMEDQGALRERV